MSKKKSPVLGAVLGFFLIGLPYSGGWSKGLTAFVVLTLVSVGLNMLLDTPICSVVVDAVGAYLGYTWVNEYNAAIDAQGVESPEAE